MEFSFEHHHRPGGFAHFSQAAALIIPSILFAVATFFAFIKVADDINRLRRSIRVSNLVGIVMFLIGYCWSVVGLATVIIRVHWVTGTDFESAVVMAQNQGIIATVILGCIELSLISKCYELIPHASKYHVYKTLGCFGVVCVFSAGNFGYYYAVCDHKWGNKEECTPYQYMDYLVYNSFINLGSIIIIAGILYSILYGFYVTLRRGQVIKIFSVLLILETAAISTTIRNFLIFYHLKTDPEIISLDILNAADILAAISHYAPFFATFVCGPLQAVLAYIVASLQHRRRTKTQRRRSQNIELGAINRARGPSPPRRPRGVSFLSPGSGFYRVNVDGGPSCSVDDVRGAPDRSRKVDGRNLRKAGIVATLEVITVSEPTF